MSPEDLRQILLLRTLEETDALGRVLPLEAREQTTRQAETAPSFLTSRATALLQRSHEGLAAVFAWAVHPPWRWLSFGGVALIMGAGLLGWLSNELGPDRRVDILAFPLLGLVIWNVLVCGLLLLPRRAKKRLGPRLALAMDKLRGQTEKRLLQGPWDETQREILLRSLLGFFQRWRERTAAGQRAKGELYFHAAALALAGSIVAGMYFQGLRKEYRASWESTFLDPPALHSLLSTVLGPASAVTQIPIPSAEALATMRASTLGNLTPTGTNAAPFIHLWAATAGLFIGLPRLLLIGLAGRRLLSDAPQDAPELARLEALYRAEASGQTSLVTVQPVYFEPEAASEEAIRLCVLHLWGGKTRLHFLPKIEFGEETEALAAAPPSASGTVLAFSFASTPEQDVQGEVIRALAARHGSLLVVTDALSFATRHHDLPEYAKRFSQRHAAWQRVIGETIPWLTLTPEVLQNPLAPLTELRPKLKLGTTSRDAR